MTWAVKLIKKVWTFDLSLSDEGFPDGRYLNEKDLVLAVLEKNKWIEKGLDELWNSDNWIEQQIKEKREEEQARAFRELVEACSTLTGHSDDKGVDE